MAVKTGNAALDNRLNYLETTFGVDTSDKAALWAREIADGKLALDDLWRGLLRNRVGREAVEEWATGIGVRQDELDGVVDNLMSGERTFNQAVQKFSNRGPSDSGAKTDADPDTLPGILAGGQTIKVAVNGTTRFYQVYEFPEGSGNFVSYQFNNKKQAEAALGKDFDVTTRSSSWYEDRVAAEASAEEVIGLGGSFRGLTREMMQDAARAAGINDPSLVGRVASNREMQQIMARALAGDWTPEQILAAQRQTDFWQNTLYPGINRFYGQTQNPEQAWNAYVKNVAPALHMLGYKPDARGTFNTQIKKMLDSNINDEVFLSQVPTFVQAKQNAKFAQTLNVWAQRELGREVTFNDWFDLLAGETMPELERVAERARLAYQAQESGAGITDAQVRRLANRTDLSDAEAAAVYADFNRSILALGDRGLARGNLTRDEVLSVAAGLNPETGRSVEEVKLAVAKLAREEALFDDDKIQFYMGFDSMGRPTRPGLQSLAPQTA